MNEKLLRADFFQPNIETKDNTPPSFVDLLKETARKREAIPYSGSPIWLQELTEVDDFILGFMVRHQSNEPAIKGNVAGELSRIELKEGEALSGVCAFLYHPEYNLLCLQRNRHAVGPSTLARYIKRCAGLDGGRIDLRVVIRPEALRRIGQMKQFRRLEVSVATFEDMKALRKDVPDVARGIEMAKLFEAPMFKFTLTMGHEQGSLRKETLIAAARELLRKRDEDPKQVQTLKIYGRDAGDDELTPIDLIENRVVYQEFVQLSDDPPELFSILGSFVRRAWDENRDEVRELSRSAL